jgi:hypothetical protein
MAPSSSRPFLHYRFVLLSTALSLAQPAIPPSLGGFSPFLDSKCIHSSTEFDFPGRLKSACDRNLNSESPTNSEFHSRGSSLRSPTSLRHSLSSIPFRGFLKGPQLLIHPWIKLGTGQSRRKGDHGKFVNSKGPAERRERRNRFTAVAIYRILEPASTAQIVNLATLRKGRQRYRCW